jgi:hypothetical protein
MPAGQLPQLGDIRQKGVQADLPWKATEIDKQAFRPKALCQEVVGDLQPMQIGSMSEKGSSPEVEAITAGEREEQPEGFYTVKSHCISKNAIQKGIWDQLEVVPLSPEDLGESLGGILGTEDLPEGIRLIL